MKYCIDFNKDSKILDKVDEINIQYDRIQDENALSQYCEEHKKQRINVCIDDLESGLKEGKIAAMLEYQDKHQDYNVYIRLDGKNEELGILLSKYPNAKFYFSTKINDWDRVIGYIEYGVSDIYIVEGLGFELDKIAAIAHEKNVQIRVFPNVAQTTWNDLDDLKKFWIRPDDIDFYSQYVDVCEFFGENEKNDILYNIYKKDKKWFGDLREIIIGLNTNIDGRYIVPRFVKKRVRCCRECLKGGNCQMCEYIRDLSNNLEKAGLMVTMEKEKEEEIDG